ncbi:MAG: hypothetical protein ABEI53_00985 [Candidatus Magasanikbacteria bacterium]
MERSSPELSRRDILVVTPKLPRDKVLNLFFKNFGSVTLSKSPTSIEVENVIFYLNKKRGGDFNLSLLSNLKKKTRNKKVDRAVIIFPNKKNFSRNRGNGKVTYRDVQKIKEKINCYKNQKFKLVDGRKNKEPWSLAFRRMISF